MSKITYVRRGFGAHVIAYLPKDGPRIDTLSPIEREAAIRRYIVQERKGEPFDSMVLWCDSDEKLHHVEFNDFGDYIDAWNTDCVSILDAVDLVNDRKKKMEAKE